MNGKYPSDQDSGDLGNILAMLRVRARISQAELARLIGVSLKTIQNWENGTSTPSAPRLKKLIEVYVQRRIFLSGKEQEEAARLWEKAAVNAAFDTAWFEEIKRTPYQQELAFHKRYPGTLDNQDVIADSYQLTQSVFHFNVPLPNPNEFYGRRIERNTLLDRTYKKASTSIVGSRKMGKTWLITYLIMVAPSQLGSRFRIAYIDATSPSCATISGFTTLVLEELGLGDGASVQANEGLAPLERAVRDMKVKNQVPVLCIDEFEGFKKIDAFNLNFLKGLRAIAQVGLVLVIASKNSLIDIVGEDGNTSGFFNIFEQLSIGPFSLKEAEAFVQSKSNQAVFTIQERERLLEYGQTTEGHWPPIRLQLVGELLLEDKLQAEIDDMLYYQPEDTLYWQMFKERLEEKYRGLVRG